MPVLEHNIETPVCRWADQRNIAHIKLNLMANRSWPDRLFFISGGRPVLIEFKRPGGRPRPLQLRTLQRLQRLGYDAHCIDTAEAGIRILKDACVRVALGQKHAHAIEKTYNDYLFGETTKTKRKPAGTR